MAQEVGGAEVANGATPRVGRGLEPRKLKLLDRVRDTV